MAENGSFAALEKWVPPFRSQLLSLSLSPGRPRPNPVITQATTEQSERASKRAREEEGTRERGKREAGCYWAHSTQRRRPPAIPPARPADRWNTLRRGGHGRGYRQLESWHQTTMEGEREEKKPDGRATAAKCLLVQSASRPPSLPLHDSRPSLFAISESIAAVKDLIRF